MKVYPGWVMATAAAVCAAAFAQEPPATEGGIEPLLERVKGVLEGAEAYLAPAADSAAEPLVLDARGAVELALAQNQQVFIAEEAIAEKQALIGQARSARLPQVKAQAGFTYIDGLEVGIGNSPIARIIIGSDSLQGEKETGRVQASVEQVLYAGGQIRAAVRASEFLARSQEWQRQAALDQIEFDAKQAFYDCLRARALVVVAQRSVVTFERHLSDARHMLDVGMVSRFEVLRAETELAARQSDLVSAQTLNDLAELNLRRILAIPADRPLEFTGDLEWTPIDAPIEAMVEEAQGARPELLALDRGIEAASQNVAAKRGQYKPKAAASLQWQHTEGGGELLPDGFTVAIGGEWDIYTGGRRRGEVAEAKAKLASLEHQREEVRQLVDVDVRQAHLRVQEAIAKIQRERGAVRLGQEGLRLAELRFQEGAGTQADTLDADLALTQAETSLVQALRDYVVAIAALDKARGRSWVERGRPES